MSGLSTRQPNSEIQDIILIVTKSEKIKYSWKRSSRVFNMMGIVVIWIMNNVSLRSNSLKKNKKTWKLYFEIYFQPNHCWTDWNGPSSMKLCSKNVQTYTLAFFHEKKEHLYIYICILIVCNANGHKSALIYTRDVDLPCSWKKHTKMPKIVVEVGYIVAMPDTLQKDKHSTKPLPEPMLMYIGWL